MAPKRPLKTYSRGNNSSISCMEALDILFAKNKTAKKLAVTRKGVRKAKNKIEVKELPQKIKSFLVDESSMHVNFDDTFDKLLRGNQCNIVKAKKMPLKRLEVITQKAKKHSVIHKFTHFHSPVFQRTRSHTSSVELAETKNDFSKNNKIDSWFNQETLDPIVDSLEIEFPKKQIKPMLLSKSRNDSSRLLRSKEKPPEVDQPDTNSKMETERSLSNNSIKTENKMKHPRKVSRFILNGSIRNSPILLRSRENTSNVSVDPQKKNVAPKIVITEVSSVCSQSQNDIANKTNSIENHNQTFGGSFFTQSLREKITVHSSTPMVPNSKRNIIKQPLSPIKIDETVEDMSKDDLVNEAIAESMQEITKWNTTFPKIDDKIDDSYHQYLDSFAGSNIEQQLINMGKFLKQKRQSLMNVKSPKKSSHSRKSKLKSYNLEEFENFHSILTSDSSDSGQQTFSLKDFETFHKEFLVRKDFVTNRKNRGIYKEHLKFLKSKFNLKNLYVGLSDIINKIETKKATKNSISKDSLKSTVRQPVINLTRLSLNNLDQKTKKDCLENLQSSNNHLQISSAKEAASNNDKCCSGFKKTGKLNKSLSKTKKNEDESICISDDDNNDVIDLTDENQKENPSIDQQAFVNVKRRTNKDSRKSTKQVLAQSTPLQENKKKNTNPKNSIAKGSWSLDLTQDENVNLDCCCISRDNIEDSIDLTCEDLNEDLEIVYDSSQDQHNLEDPEKTKTDLEELFGLSRVEASKTNNNVSENSCILDLEKLFEIPGTSNINDMSVEKSQTVEIVIEDDTVEVSLDKSPPEFYGFSSISKPAVISFDDSADLNEKIKEPLNNLLVNKSHSLDNIHQKARHKDISKKKGGQPPKINIISVTSGNVSSESVLVTNNTNQESTDNLLIDESRSLNKISQKEVETHIEKSKAGQPSKINIISVTSSKPLVSAKSRTEDKRKSLQEILNEMLLNVSKENVKNSNGLSKSKIRKYSLRSKYDIKKCTVKTNNNKTKDSTLLEESSNHESTIEEDASSIFFKSLQLVPSSSLTINKKTTYKLRSKTNNEKINYNYTFSSIENSTEYSNNTMPFNSTENTLPNVWDNKNLVVNVTNRSLSKFVEVIEDDNVKDNELVVEKDIVKSNQLVVDITLKNLEVQKAQLDFETKTSKGSKQERKSKEKYVSNKKQSQDVIKEKSVPISVLPDVIIDLTLNDFDLDTTESDKLLENLDTSNIIVTDPMEEELEIACCSPRKNVKVRRSTETFSNDTTLQNVPDAEVSSTNSNSVDVIESSLNSTNDAFKMPLALPDSHKPRVTLKAGKSWRRSLLAHKRDSFLDLSKDISDLGTSSLSNTTLEPRLSQKRQSFRILPVQTNVTNRKTSILQKYALHTILDESENNISIWSESSPLRKKVPTVSARDIVLKKCGQTEPLPFTQLYPPSLLKDCKKIGEGVYGEVFLYTRPNGQSTVMKVIPIEGSLVINGERQKKFDEILSEIVISSELSSLRSHTANNTDGFCEVQRICCVKGAYPDRLLDLWEQYDGAKGSENDSPEVFTKDQLYIVLDLANAGQDLEAFLFHNASQACAMFQQVACALACAEEQLKFEHRDLHWGNILLRQVEKNKKVTCKLKNKKIVTQTKGVEATIIDFTLSRMTTDGVVMFNDLSIDPDLFTGEGDYQFDVYRNMKSRNGNDWEKFEPYSNIQWLHYILDKSIKQLRYKSTTTKIHSTHIEELQKIENIILEYDSVQEFVSSFYC